MESSREGRAGRAGTLGNLVPGGFFSSLTSEGQRRTDKSKKIVDFVLDTRGRMTMMYFVSQTHHD